MSLISIQNLCFAYDTREVLHDINVAIEPGMFAAMVGPNGGGKTTLLKLILGLLKPLHGSISVFGKAPQDARIDLGYVPQSLSFDPRFPATVLDIVLMGRLERHFCGKYSREDKDIARQCLADVQLDGFASRPFSDLSGGERQRVLIAQAIASQPKILLLDEPGANLDPKVATTIFQLLKKLNETLTILMVSHNLGVVSAFVSHVICINHTATMHDIKELHTDPVTGNWLRLTHDTCPVSTGIVTIHEHSHE